MACYNNCYLPNPPRAWSRVQNSCSVTTDIDSSDLVRLPYSDKLVSSSILGESIAMLNKGNVLQYKANSSNLTQAQKYSKIAQGKWTNRNTTWATQNTRGYTNPNTTSLKRSGNVNNIAIDPITGTIIGQTQAPVTCLKPITIINEGLPSNGGGGTGEPQIPPPVPPTPASDTFPSIISDTPVEPVVIQDEGTLICSVQENICTGETQRTQSQQLCNPTSDSDVPGTIQLLCWNDGTPTWYPRQRYIMSNSTNKWPVNAILSSSVRPSSPIIISIVSNEKTVTITWIQDTSCLPVSTYDIYQNGILVKTVPGTVFSTTISVSSCNTYQYFIVAVTNGSNIFSEPSNSVYLTVNASTSPQNPVVNWASVDFDDIIMDINMNFETPASILCGTPDYFVLNVFNSTNNIIATQIVDYVSGKTLYEVNFNDIPYSATGIVNIYLVTINNDTGQTFKGDIATCNYVSSDLPIYVNSIMNPERTQWSFRIITQSLLNKVAGIITPSILANEEGYIYWETLPIASSTLIIYLNVLANNEYGYDVTMYASIMGLEYFPSPVACVTSNLKGISANGSA